MNIQGIIGRDEQLQRLNTDYDQMLRGENRLCFVTGVAGSGKTYLIEHFLRECVDREQVVVAEGACNKHAGEAEAYFPFLEILKSFSAGISQCEQGSGHRLSALFKRFGKAFADVLVEQAPDLLGTFIPGGSTVIKTIQAVHERSNSVSRLDAVLNRPGTENSIDTNRIQFQFSQILRALSGTFPLVLSIDDLHWSDDESLDLLYYLARKLEGCPVMIICSYRRNDLLANHGDRHPFVSMANELKRYYGDIWIDLDNIVERDGERFTRELLDSRSNDFTEDFYRAFYKHTDGHPLFSVELLRNFIENGLVRKNAAGRWEAMERLEWSTLSPRVEGIIEERIGRLDDELRDILSIASAEGCTFSVPVVGQILDIQERKLVKLLSNELGKKHQLVEEENTKKVGDCWMTHYRFAHFLFQQHLYNELSTRERMIAHDDIAVAMVKIYSEDNEEMAAWFAYHFDQGGSTKKALPFYLKAGKRASSLCGYPHALRLLQRGLNIVESLDSEDNDLIELELKVQYGIALKAVKRWDDEEVLDILLEAEEMGEELGQGAEMGPVLFSLWGGFLIKLDLDRAMNIAQRMQRTGDRTGDDVVAMQAHLALSDTLFWTGRFEEGLAHNDRFYDLCDRAKRSEMIASYGQDSTVLADMYEMLHCTMLGRYSRAERRLSKVDRSLKRMKHRYSQAIGYVSLAWGAYELERYDEMDRYSLELIELSTKNVFDYYLGYGQLFRGVALAKAGEHAEGLRLLDEGAHRISSGRKAWLNQSLYGVMKSQILVAQKAYQHAAEVAEKIGALSKKQKDVCYLPELLRLQSLAHEKLGNGDKADELLRSAIEQSRQMGANVFFLRGAEQQARRERGDRITARRVLEEAMQRIDSGEPCPDIKRVHKLQKSLAQL